MKYDMPFVDPQFYAAALPILIVIVGSLIVMMQSVFKSIRSRSAVFGVTLLTLVAALVANFTTRGLPASYLAGTFLSESLGTWGMGLLLGVATCLVCMIRGSLWDGSFFRGEISSLFLMLLSGMMVVVTSDDLITMFVGLELASIGIYAILGYMHPTRRSQEGAIKYFILGAFAAAFLLFGFALIYGATGTMKIAEIIPQLVAARSNTWIQIGGLFALVGLGFKFALAPFHLWAPDAYEGAPTPITGFMATAVKVMVIIFTLRIFASGSASGVYQVWKGGMLFMAMLSMIFGNILALVQTSIKRMLAYSSIAHSGYMAVALASIGGQTGSNLPVPAVLFYVLSYCIVSLGAFGVLMWLEHEQNDNTQLDDLAGLSKKHPWAALALTVFLFSFAGMPPTVGFISKFFVFSAAIEAKLYSLVLIGALGSAISLFYYLRVIVRMYMNDEVQGSLLGGKRLSASITCFTVAALALTILLGTVFPGHVLDLMEGSARGLYTAHH